MVEINYGTDAGKLAVIVDIVDQARVSFIDCGDANSCRGARQNSSSSQSVQSKLATEAVLLQRSRYQFLLIMASAQFMLRLFAQPA